MKIEFGKFVTISGLQRYEKTGLKVLCLIKIVESSLYLSQSFMPMIESVQYLVR